MSIFRWMNGQHLRARPSQEVTQFIGDRWKASDLFIVSAGPFVDYGRFPIIGLETVKKIKHGYVWWLWKICLRIICCSSESQFSRKAVRAENIHIIETHYGKCCG
nr:uncharacterized protein LOC112782775 isoform X4 [Arachis hypogaea]